MEQTCIGKRLSGLRLNMRRSSVVWKKKSYRLSKSTLVYDGQRIHFVPGVVALALLGYRDKEIANLALMHRVETDLPLIFIRKIYC